MTGVLRLWSARLHLSADPQSDKMLGNFLVLGLPFAGASVAVVWFRWCETVGGAGVFGLIWAGYLLTLRSMGVWQSASPWMPAYQAAVVAGIVWACTLLDALWSVRYPARVGVR